MGVPRATLHWDRATTPSALSTPKVVDQVDETLSEDLDSAQHPLDGRFDGVLGRAC